MRDLGGLPPPGKEDFGGPAPGLTPRMSTDIAGRGGFGFGGGGIEGGIQSMTLDERNHMQNLIKQADQDHKRQEEKMSGALGGIGHEMDIMKQMEAAINPAMQSTMGHEAFDEDLDNANKYEGRHRFHAKKKKKADPTQTILSSLADQYGGGTGFDPHKIALKTEADTTADVLKSMFGGTDPRAGFTQIHQDDDDPDEPTNKYGDKLSYAEKMLPPNMQQDLLKERERKRDMAEKASVQNTFLNTDVLKGLGFDMSSSMSFAKDLPKDDEEDNDTSFAEVNEQTKAKDINDVWRVQRRVDRDRKDTEDAEHVQRVTQGLMAKSDGIQDRLRPPTLPHALPDVDALGWGADGDAENPFSAGPGEFVY